jgi:predicted nucleotidyltransferase
MTDFKTVIRVLGEGSVDFIVIGGLAAVMHGAARLTFDVDIVYDRSPENIRRLVLALMPYHPYPRGAPPGLPFRWDAATIERGLNFTLTSDIGDVDILGEIVGGGNYEALLPRSVTKLVYGIECRCLGLEALVRVKRATGRPKDFEALAELEALLSEQRRAEGR